MVKVKSFCARIAASRTFEIFIMLVILVNCVSIGAETYEASKTLSLINNICLGIYTVEIIIRYIGSTTLKSFLSRGWNLFDLFVVLVSYIPEDISENSSVVAAIRVLRVFRILKIFKTSKELKLIVSVMLRSMKSLTYNALVMLIFMYVFAISGIYFFRLPTAENATPEQQAALIKLNEIAPHAPGNSDDPYGTLSEAMFTLLRSMSGDDWTDIRYNLITAERLNLININPTLITIFHVVWYLFAAFLLINLVVGAVINNYQVIMDAEKSKADEELEIDKKETEEVIKADQ